MRLILTLALFCFTLLGCKLTTKNKSKEVDIIKPTKQVIGKKFFEYDAIDHYRNDIAGSDYDLYVKQSETEIDLLKKKIIVGYFPNSISDSAFIDKLEKIGYKKTSIDTSKFGSIDEIFVEKTALAMMGSYCLHTYRDILIFKKNNKVVGTAKICFDCKDYQIHGTTANIRNFGQDGDYEKLEKLLLGSPSEPQK